MSLDVVPFEGRLVERAAALLAAAHESAAGLDLGDVDVARRLVEGWQDTGPAVAAVEDGTLLGFMAATLADRHECQRARIRMHQHAAAHGADREIYRRLYGVLAGRLAELGAFEHTVVVSASHDDVVTCLFELGFGADQIKGLRPVSAPIRTVRDVRLREADAGDMEDLLRLTVELQRFHAEPPALRPAFVDLRSIRDGFHAALLDENQLLLVAEEDGRLTGMMQAGPDNRYVSTATIGIAVVAASVRSKGVGTALLSGVVGWAADHGFGTCGVGWTSANLVSDAFWRGHGFTPVGYELTRLIDPRVSWADAHLDYRYHLPMP